MARRAAARESVRCAGRADTRSSGRARARPAAGPPGGGGARAQHRRQPPAASRSSRRICAPGYLRKNGVPYSERPWSPSTSTGSRCSATTTCRSSRSSRPHVPHDAIRRQQPVQARARRLELESHAVRDRCTARHVSAADRSDAYEKQTQHGRRARVLLRSRRARRSPPRLSRRTMSRAIGIRRAAESSASRRNSSTGAAARISATTPACRSTMRCASKRRCTHRRGSRCRSTSACRIHRRTNTGAPAGSRSSKSTTP